MANLLNPRFRKVIPVAEQGDLFVRRNFLFCDTKNCSQFEKHDVSIAHPNPKTLDQSAIDMLPRKATLLLPFEDESSAIDAVVEPFSSQPQVTTTDAIQNDHTRTTKTVPSGIRSTRGQQYFAFDDGATGDSPAESSPQPVRPVANETARRIDAPALERSHGERRENTRGLASGFTGDYPQSNHNFRNRLKRSSPNHHRPLLEGLDEAPVLAQVESTQQPIQVAANSEPIAAASGDKSKARDIIQAIRLMQQLERDGRTATHAEKHVLARFGGFGPVALSLFPDPVTGKYKDHGWQILGEELESLLSPDEYDSAKRTTFNAFYTSPGVIQAMHRALDRLGTPNDALVLEPGCGVGNFLGHAGNDKRFIGVELDRTSGRIAKALHPEHDIRIENFRDTKLPIGKLDAVIGNVPFANVKMEHAGQRFSLHDYFFAKSIDALKPGGVMALVTSHFTLDKQNAAIREYLAKQADFVGAIRLPAEAFKVEGTKVVTDIVFLRKRPNGAEPKHIDDDWMQTAPTDIEGSSVHVNRYFINHPEMVLGTWTRAHQLYGDDGFSVRSNGNLDQQLQAAIARLPEIQRITPVYDQAEPAPARFTRPPPLKHLAEGSFFIGDDKVIYQIENGHPEPAMHGSTKLSADGTMMGKRLAALIGLRDAARLVLQSQNEGWPEFERQATRKSLGALYDQFVSHYGAINKTSFSQNRDGTVIRRMPNLLKFRDDPDAMLVLSLEDYDEVTNVASKTAIFGQDVVGRKPAIEHVASVEEGLLVSLDQRGGIDLPFISSLYGRPEADIIRELGDLIYLNPETKAYETADVYLSGNVRAKLKAALLAGPEFARNAEQLNLVQPPDVTPGDIDANLGAPWIPASDIQAFAADLFHVPLTGIAIGHLKKDAVWSVDPAYATEQSVAALSEYGTSRANGTSLLELALNMKSPLIYDTIRTTEGEERVVNQEETLAAREKQRLIKEKLRSWVFSDPDRTERLVRIYNDTYNNLRPRRFDGSHLEFSGMNQTISLRPHQKDAIWRAMSSGNTLLAHAVGAGKTFTMAATGMKLKQAGLVHKPMYVVPNHMLEQFSREFMQLYPNARLLVASKDDMSRDRRKHLTAKIASGQWDGIIVTHSSFERIGMSPEYQERFLRDQIAEYDQLLSETAKANSGGKHRNLIKTIEKQKANRENRLTELLAEDKKDDGLVFDELGVDHIFIDEAHYFKNLETPTKMDRVAGIQTGGSQRAFDLFMKARYLGDLHAGHGVTFATGTPISNTMVEMYNLQRFLDPQGLNDRGIEHFDAWAATFGEVVETMEISPDGASLRPRSRFARFNNLPELQQMFRAFADVQTSDMLDLPRPRLRGGKPVTVSCPMSDAQSEIQQRLVERYDRLRSQKVDPREDNALAITTDGRKLALDARMVDPNANDAADSKINKLVDNVARIWEASKSTRGTQLIFSDMGVNPTPWNFGVYDEIIAKLIARGIPASEIASIGDAESDAKKQVLFEKVRNGTIRVLLGSTQKMGTGTNVQKRLIALHHLDAPWKPAEVEQRDGRILRQGNLNEEVDIYRYVTEGSFDAYMWQALETKARFISQIMTGGSTVRNADDIGGQELSYAEVKAIASGNPAVLTLAETDAELQRLLVLRKNHADEQFLARRRLKELPDRIESLSNRMTRLTQDAATLAAHRHDDMVINGQSCLRDHVTYMLNEQLARIPDEVKRDIRVPIGKFQGLAFGIHQAPHSSREVYLEGATTRSVTLSRDHGGPRAVMNALNRIAENYPSEIRETKQSLELAEQQLRDFNARIGQAFQPEAYCKALASLRDELKQSLSEQPAQSESKPARPTSEITEDIKQLQASHTTEDVEKRPIEHVAVTLEEPISARLKRIIAEPSETLDVSEVVPNASVEHRDVSVA